MIEFREPGEWAAGNPSSESPPAFAVRRERVTKLHAGAMGDALRELLASATTRRLSGDEYAIAEAMVAEFERRAKRHG